MEGTARYIEFHACPGGYDLNANDWLYRTDISQYMYATGFNIVRLLDKLGGGAITRRGCLTRGSHWTGFCPNKRARAQVPRQCRG